MRRCRACLSCWLPRCITDLTGIKCYDVVSRSDVTFTSSEIKEVEFGCLYSLRGFILDRLMAVCCPVYDLRGMQQYDLFLLSVCRRCQDPADGDSHLLHSLGQHHHAKALGCCVGESESEPDLQCPRGAAACPHQ